MNPLRALALGLLWSAGFMVAIMLVGFASDRVGFALLRPAFLVLNALFGVLGIELPGADRGTMFLWALLFSWFVYAVFLAVVIFLIARRRDARKSDGQEP